MENLEGKIIYWNGIYGFIETNEGSSIFFHKSDLIDKNIQLLDSVSYVISKSIIPMHNGKIIAKEIKLTGEKTNIKSYSRYIGVITDLNNKKGIIKSPEIEKPILFYTSRKLFIADVIKENDLIIFCPEKSSRNNYELFSLFAYSIKKENDIDFLQKAYLTSGNEKIKYYIDLRISKLNISVAEKFDLDIKGIPYVNNNHSYQIFVSKLLEYKKLNFTPHFDIIKGHCDKTFVIQLFESGIINDYDVEIMKPYFHNTSADKKRFIISKVSYSDGEIFLRNHYNKLKEEGKFNFLNDNIKTLLDIVYRNEITKNEILYNEIKDNIESFLKPDEIINLWLNGYIDELQESFLIENCNIDNRELIKSILDKKDAKYKIALYKIFEHYFFKTNKINIDTESDVFIRRLLIFQHVFKSRFDEIIIELIKFFDDYQKFKLWIFGITKVDFNVHEYYLYNKSSIDIYSKIKYSLKSFDEHVVPNQIIDEILDEISFESLLLYIKTNPWDDLIYPVEELDSDTCRSYFLSDIQKLCRLFKDINIDINSLADEIFISMPKYNVHHIRLWLNGYVANKRYDYVGFRNCFKFLNKDEQIEFKQRGDDLVKGNVFEKTSFEVLPCETIIEETSSYKLYSARLYNFFFEQNKLRLRKEDKLYTSVFKDFYSSYAFNNIPTNSALNKYEITVKVGNNNTIDEINGFDKIIQLIHTNEIEKALGVVVNPKGKSKPTNNPYVEDWELVNEIKMYLFVNQFSEIDVRLVLEPVNHFRRLDESSGIDNTEQTALFTLATKSEDYVIIWDNIDFSDNRAIYVFKSTNDNINTQLNKITSSITTMAQLRSTLIRTNIDDMDRIFKANLGYVGKIHKKRGDNLAFEIWLDNLKNLMNTSTPTIPTIEEIELLEKWSPDTPHHGSVVIKPQKILNKEIITVGYDFQEYGSSPTINQKNEEDIDIEVKKQLYNSLKFFNDSMHNILNN
jgi:hypothetical protein